MPNTPNTPEGELESPNQLQLEEHPKAQLEDAIQSSKDTIHRSESVMDGVKKITDEVADMPESTAQAPQLNSLNELVQLHPVGVTRKLVNGVSNISGGLMKTATLPVRMGATGLLKGAEAMKSAAKIPLEIPGMIAKSPFYAWNTINRGFDKIFNIKDSIWNFANKKIDDLVKVGKTTQTTNS